MKNLGQMMKQAQEMQNKLAEMQEGLGNIEVIGQSGGGMIQVTLSGKSEARKIAIDPSLTGAEDKEVLATASDVVHTVFEFVVGVK